MTDYTKTTNFASKDDLPAGAAAKEIVGLEWDDELAAISTAIASKYDSTDLADQSTAEAGTSNTTLVTPLRTMQELLALKTSRLSATFDAKVTKAQLGVDTTVVLGAAEGSLFTISVPAAGLYMYDVYLRFSTQAEWHLRPVFSGTATAHAVSLYGQAAAGGVDKASGFPQSGTSESVVATLLSSAVAGLRGVLLCTTAGTIDVRAQAVISGFPSDPVVDDTSYIALRRLA